MKSTKDWIKIGIINFLIVGTLGVLMRYKIGFEFPYFDQKQLLHAHSHFAFAGWITHVLYVLLVRFLKVNARESVHYGKYNRLIWANIITAYGMLFSFAMQGYGVVSITFSTASILINYLFTIQYWKDLNQNRVVHPSTNWFKAALIFGVLSSLGTFVLAYMMATKHITQNLYLASVYFYLHFQYSGWFFFSIMGLFLSKLSLLPTFVYDKKLFQFFFIACFPAYMLSILWLDLPIILYIFVILAALLQFAGLYKLIVLIKSNLKQIQEQWHKTAIWVLGLSFLALVIKLTLQGGSTIPEISRLAFGFRSIVIAYLHLVLLAFTSLFLVGFLFSKELIPNTKMSRLSVMLLATGVFLNEFVLMIQGVASFSYIMIPYLNEVLFIISLFLFVSIAILLTSLFQVSNVSK